ncbi:MAG: deaminase [Actinomycetota bacterium]
MTDRSVMDLCVESASAAAEAGAFPNGSAVVGVDGAVLAVSRSHAEDTPDPTAHAEVSAIRAAAAGHGVRVLEGGTLFTTLEPCAMCLHAAASAGIVRIVYGCERSAVGDGAYVSTASAADLSARLIRPIVLEHLPAPGIADRVTRFLTG